MDLAKMKNETLSNNFVKEKEGEAGTMMANMKWAENCIKQKYLFFIPKTIIDDI